MAAKYEVLITPKAMDMLITHIRFLANVSEKAARTLHETFRQETNKLQNMPTSFPPLLYPYFPIGKYRKLIIGKYYMAIFQIKAHKVYVHYVVDTRQDYAWLLDDK